MQIDPYANAYTLDYRVWEQKFELDSLAYPITLAWSYWKTTGDTSIFTGDSRRCSTRRWRRCSANKTIRATRSYTHKELAQRRQGRPVGYTGMIWTGFRPSDDACYTTF